MKTSRTLIAVAVVALGLLSAGMARAEKLQLSRGQLVYVPAYTFVYYTIKGKTFPITTTLVMHNTDPGSVIRIISAKFLDAQGALVREYVDAPVTLKPYGSLDVLVKKTGTAKGSGACFLVEWRADKKVSAPIIECILIGASAQQGISFRTEGRVIREFK